MVKTKFEITGIGLIFGIIFLLAIREWFVEIIQSDVQNFLNTTPVETWFIIAMVALAGAIFLGMGKK